jgi:hypothetical protein
VSSCCPRTFPILSLSPLEDLGTLNPDLYRDSVDATCDGNEPTVRFGLRFHDAKEWLEIRIVRIRVLPQHLDEISIKYESSMAVPNLLINTIAVPRF